MNVATFDPTRISVTDAAAAHIREQVARCGRHHLRLGVRESGCNGYMYVLDYIDAPADDDRAFPIGADVSVYVSQGDLPMVRGTEVDLVTEGLNSSLRFKNPNASAHCGCGESFSVDGSGA